MTKTPEKGPDSADDKSGQQDSAAKESTASKRLSPHSSTFGFFGKYQRIILYTAGIFALVSFSITGALQSLFSDAFYEPPPQSTIEIRGKKMELTAEDLRVGGNLARVGTGPVIVLPTLSENDREQNMDVVYASMRRAALEYGIEVSEDEIDRALAEAVATLPDARINTPQDLAIFRGYASLEAYRADIREAMRIGLYARLQALAIDVSDAALVEDILEQQEMVQLKVASLDRQALEDELKATEVSDADLQTWLDGLSEEDKQSYGFYDSDRARLRIAKLDLDAFDPAPFAEELGARTISDEEVQSFYEGKKALWYKLAKEEEEKPPKEENPEEQDPAPIQDEFIPLDDALKANIRKRLEAREILRMLWAGVVKEQGDALLPLSETRTQANQKRLEAMDEQAAAQVALDSDPDNEDKKRAVSAADDKLTAATKTYEDAGEALDAGRSAFDMEAALARVLADRDASAFSYLDSAAQPQNATDLESIEGLGDWADAWAGVSHQKTGELSSSVQESKDALFHYQVLELELRPLKEFVAIKDEARAEYYSKKADELGKEKAEAFEAALLRLGKEARADEVSKLESDKAAELAKSLEDWRQQTSEERDAAQLQVNKLSEDQASGAYRRWKEHLDDLLVQLADEDTKREALDEELSAKLETDIAEEAEKAYKEVVEAAAVEVGFTLESLEAQPRNLSSKGAPREIFPETVQFLFYSRGSDLADLEEGDVSDLLEDMTKRRYYMAVCDSVEKASIADLTRRDLELGRRAAAQARLSQGMAQSFTEEALGERIKLTPPVETPKAEPVGSSASSSGPEKK